MPKSQRQRRFAAEALATQQWLRERAEYYEAILDELRRDSDAADGDDKELLLDIQEVEGLARELRARAHTRVYAASHRIHAVGD